MEEEQYIIQHKKSFLTIMDDNSSPDATKKIPDIVQHVKSFLDAYNGNIPLNFAIVSTKEAVYGNNAEEKGISEFSAAMHRSKNLVVLNASQLHSEQEVIESLRHEVFGHYGLLTLNPDEKIELLNEVLQTRHDPALKEVWGIVDANYTHLNDWNYAQYHKAEEVFAFVAQKPELFFDNCWTKVRAACAKALRKCGLISKNITAAELRVEALRISEGIKKGEREQKIFPKNDHVLFKKSLEEAKNYTHVKIQEHESHIREKDKTTMSQTDFFTPELDASEECTVKPTRQRENLSVPGAFTDSPAPPNEETSAAKQKTLPEYVQKNFIELNGNFYFHNRTPAFSFKNDEFKTKGNKPEVVKAIVAIAKTQEWNSITVTGNKDFRRSVYLEAAAQGLDVTGYSPTKVEKAQADKLREQYRSNEQENSVREDNLRQAEFEQRRSMSESSRDNPATDVAAKKAQAFREDKESEVLKQYPELAKAYGTMTVAKKFAEKNLEPEQANVFLEKVKESYAEKIERGEDLPAATLKRSGILRFLDHFRAKKLDPERAAQATPEPERAAQATPEPERAAQATPEPEKAAQATPEQEKAAQATPEPERAAQATPEPERAAQATPEPEKAAQATPEQEKAAQAMPEQEKTAQAMPEQEKTAQAMPEQEKAAQATPEQEKAAQATPEPERAAQATPEPERAAQATPEPEKAAQATPEQEKAAQAMPEPERAAQATPEPERAAQATPEPERAAQATPEPEKAAQATPEQEKAAQAEKNKQGEIKTADFISNFSSGNYAFDQTFSGAYLAQEKAAQTFAKMLEQGGLPKDRAVLIAEVSKVKEGVAPDVFAKEMAENKRMFESLQGESTQEKCRVLAMMYEQRMESLRYNDKGEINHNVINALYNRQNKIREGLEQHQEWKQIEAAKTVANHSQSPANPNNPEQRINLEDKKQFVDYLQKGGVESQQAEKLFEERQNRKVTDIKAYAKEIDYERQQISQMQTRGYTPSEKTALAIQKFVVENIQKNSNAAKAREAQEQTQFLTLMKKNGVAAEKAQVIYEARKLQKELDPEGFSHNQQLQKNIVNQCKSANLSPEQTNERIAQTLVNQYEDMKEQASRDPKAREIVSRVETARMQDIRQEQQRQQQPEKTRQNLEPNNRTTPRERGRSAEGR